MGTVRTKTRASVQRIMRNTMRSIRRKTLKGFQENMTRSTLRNTRATRALKDATLETSRLLGVLAQMRDGRHLVVSTDQILVTILATALISRGYRLLTIQILEESISLRGPI